jgi:SAM-dependent methyltransferase
MGELYRDPLLYEQVFSRDIVSQVDTLEAWYGAHRDGRPRRVLELAAGPAAHAIEFARRGARGTALDLSAVMCAHARRRAREAGVALDVVRADMVAFDLGSRFDLVLTLLDSASHLLDLDSMVSHLRAVRAHLAPGGLYVMEMAHPADFFAAPRTQDRWRVRAGDVSLDVRWSLPMRAFDPITQTGEHRIAVTVTENGSRRIVRDSLTLRHWTATELDAAVRLVGGLDVVARHGSFEPDAPFVSGPGEWRMISIVQRQRQRRAR